jgi:hypothetical protein
MRRALLALALLLAPAAALPVAAGGDPAHPWDATWAGGWTDDASGEPDGVQVIVAEDQVVALFLHGEYLDADDTGPLAADGSLAFSWIGGHATLKRDGATAEIVIDEDGLPERVVTLQSN